MALLRIAPNDALRMHAIATGSNGVPIHYLRRGTDSLVLLLRGWPGFWYDWRAVIPELATRADVIAPDFRDFGHSGQPTGAAADVFAPNNHANDIVTLMDHLELDQALLIGHDIGPVVAQTLAQKAPDRFPRLVLLNPPHPGIGARRFEPEATPEFWYYNFHNLHWAPDLVAYDRNTHRMYLHHFYDHWVGRKVTVDPLEFEAIVDNFARPGVFAGTIGFYRARAAQRRGPASASRAEPILQPTRILWGALDPVIKSDWSDRLGEYFSSTKLDVLPDAGHFLPFEAPVEVLAAIESKLAALTAKP